MIRIILKSDYKNCVYDGVEQPLLLDLPANDSESDVCLSVCSKVKI